MKLDEIIKALPPIILGFGGILPALIVSSQSIFADAPKALLCTIMVLVVWIGYWAVLMYWQLLLFNDWVTLGFLIFAALLLCWVFLGALPRRVENPSDVSGRIDQVPGDRKGWRQFLRKLLIPAETPKTIYLITYIAALTCVSIAAALYVGPKGRVIVKLEGPAQVESVKVIWHNRPNPQSITHKRDRNGARVVLTEDEFADATSFVINGTTDAIWIAERAAARAVVSPGLGERYVITAEQAK